MSARPHRFGFSAIALAALSTGASVWAETPPERSHADEIQAYATIAAMAQTASDRCADVLVNQTMLAKAPGYFHMTPDDRQAYLLAVQIEMQRLAATVERAPNVTVWCDEAYRAYGPDGDTAKGLLGK